MKKMRRKDREMDREFALGIVDKCEYAVLSMTDEKNMPYCVPISIVCDNDVIYFHCARDGKKVDVMQNNPNVCIACVGDTKRALDKFTTEYESAIICGEVREVTSDEEKIHALRLLCQRHTPTNMQNFDTAIEQSLSRTAIWKVQIISITGKRKKSDQTGKEMKFGRMQ